MHPTRKYLAILLVGTSALLAACPSGTTSEQKVLADAQIALTAAWQSASDALHAACDPDPLSDLCGKVNKAYIAFASCGKVAQDAITTLRSGKPSTLTTTQINALIATMGKTITSQGAVPCQ